MIENKEQTLASAECLLEYLRVHGGKNQAYQALWFLAEQTIVRLSENKVPNFNYHSIQGGVKGDVDSDPCAWFNRQWGFFTGKFRDSHEEGLQKFAADRGLRFYPWVAKIENGGGAGNQTLIALQSLPIPDTVTTSTTPQSPHEVAYIPVANLKLAWWTRWIFDKEGLAQGWRKHLLLWPNLIWLFTVALFGVATLYQLSKSNSPITTSDLVLLIYLGLVTWYSYYLANRLNRLVEDRIIMAAEIMLGAKEFNVCLELARSPGGGLNTPKRAKMVKYAGTCLVCNAQVLLDNGEPDFPRRIVGRCTESPREHVFSFDRTTLTGYRLR